MALSMRYPSAFRNASPVSTISDPTSRRVLVDLDQAEAIKKWIGVPSTLRRNEISWAFVAS